MNKTFIVAEIGINANGQLEIAKKLIDIAKFAGCDAVKFQKRNIYKVYSKEYLKQPRNDNNPFGWKTQEEQKLGLEFNKEEYDEIDKYCKEKQIEWFASVWDLDSVDFIEQYNPKYYKIPSALIVHKELLEKVAKLKKYTFISTGMSTLDEIREAVEIFRNNNCPFELMHCNSSYPCPLEDINLRVIRLLRHEFDCKVGYSNHSPGIIPSVAAVAIGATSIEVHITLDRTMYGSDQASSIEKFGLMKLVEYIRAVEVALGDGIKRITELEEKVKKKLRRYKDY